MGTNIIIIFIFVVHYIADFLLQTREMGENKSKSIKWLSIHVFVYSFVTTAFWMVGFDRPDFLFASQMFLITFVTHFITDFITSKISSYFYYKSISDKPNRKKWMGYFWYMIGFDQLVHAITLLLTLNYLI